MNVEEQILKTWIWSVPLPESTFSPLREFERTGCPAVVRGEVSVLPPGQLRTAERTFDVPVQPPGGDIWGSTLVRVQAVEDAVCACEGRNRIREDLRTCATMIALVAHRCSKASEGDLDRRYLL